jgi:hypothetical protein
VRLPDAHQRSAAGAGTSHLAGIGLPGHCGRIEANVVPAIDCSPEERHPRTSVPLERR